MNKKMEQCNNKGLCDLQRALGKMPWFFGVNILEKTYDLFINFQLNHICI